MIKYYRVHQEGTGPWIFYTPKGKIPIEANTLEEAEAKLSERKSDDV